jgi:hypothetical protein
MQAGSRKSAGNMAEKLGKAFIYLAVFFIKTLLKAAKACNLRALG